MVKVVMQDESLSQGIKGEVISVYTVKSNFDGVKILNSMALRLYKTSTLIARNKAIDSQVKSNP